MNGTKQTIDAIKAGYTFFYCQTYEMNKTVEVLKTELDDFIASSNNFSKVVVWDLSISQEGPDEVLATLNQPGTVVIAKNFNWFLQDDYGKPEKQICNFLQLNVDLFSTPENRAVLIVVGNVGSKEAIPELLRKDFMNVSFDLPTKAEIETILDVIINSVKENRKFVVPTKEERIALIDTAKGMTKREISNAYSFSLIKKKGVLDASVISEIRAENVKETAGLKLIETDLTFKSLKGYENLKVFTKSTILSPLAKGIILLGPPGTGKSHFCRCLANETGLTMFEMEMAEMMGSLVGESEKLMKSAIDIITANSPCILFVDEMEKALAGVGGGGQTGDGGTTKRSMAQFLKFLSDEDKRKGIYVIATCNDIKALPPEWVRPGRWDSAPFFIDLPTEVEKKEILTFYQGKYKVNGTPNMEGWSGAEIESCCRIASMMGTTTKQASKFIVPVSKTMKNEIEGLRTWAKDKTIKSSVIAVNEIKTKAIEL